MKTMVFRSRFLLLPSFAGASWLLVRHSHGPSSDQLDLYGNVDIRQVDLAFNGRIARILVQEGEG